LISHKQHAKYIMMKIRTLSPQQRGQRTKRIDARSIALSFYLQKRPALYG